MNKGFHLDQPVVCQKSMRGDLRVKTMDPVPEIQRKPGRERDGRPATHQKSMDSRKWSMAWSSEPRAYETAPQILGSGLNPRRRSGLNRRLTNRPGHVADWMAESIQAGDS